MKTIRSLEDLNHFREEIVEKRQRQAELRHIQVIVSLGTCGIAAGALDTLNTVRQMVEDEKIKNVTILESGCIGLCRDEPILEVIVGDGPRVTYGRAVPETARKIMRSHVIEGKVAEEFVIESLPFPTI